jgi:hypothetical protein
MRCSRQIPRLASVTAGALLFYGCAAPLAQPVGVPVTSSTTPAGGRIAAHPGRPGFVLAAPHGGSDLNTDDMAAEIARRTGFGLVVASGFSVEGGEASEPEAYEKRVMETAQGPLRFYAELHGHGRQECAGQIEIATVGIDREFALRLRALAELIRDAHLRTNREVQRLDVLIEPADPVTYRASGAKRDGILHLPQRALHIELPRCARRDWRDVYTAVLADFLGQAVMLPVGR